MNARRLAPLGALLAAAILYLIVAWPVPPGFFDGLEPPGPYRWTSPPPTFRKGNQSPLYGHVTLPLGTGGSVPPGTAFTRDGQASISWTSGVFAPLPGQSDVVFRITPETSYPKLPSVYLSTNVYCVTTMAHLKPGERVLVTLTYSPGIPVPTSVYTYTKGGESWRDLRSISNQVPLTVSAWDDAVACYAAGVETAPARSLWPSGPLPYVVAGLLVLFVLAALPPVLAGLRRRRRRGQPPASST